MFFTKFQGILSNMSRGLPWSKVVREEIFELEVHLACDEETGRWFVAESDIPGLWLEAENATDLIHRIQLAAPEMIALNEAEIVGACWEKSNTKRTTSLTQAQPKPKIRPVFDSPLDLAFA